MRTTDRGAEVSLYKGYFLIEQQTEAVEHVMCIVEGKGPKTKGESLSKYEDFVIMFLIRRNVLVIHMGLEFWLNCVFI